MKRILVVDDEILIVDMLERFLKMKGFEVVRATGGEAALKALGSASVIDLIIMDIRMPKVNGEDAAKKVKDSCNEIPIIYLTGAIDIGKQFAQDERSDIPEEDVLRKPIELSDLLKKIEEKLYK